MSNILNTIQQYVELELKFAELEQSLTSLQNSLYYSHGKGTGWETSVEYTAPKPATKSNHSSIIQYEHQKQKDQYLNEAREMTPQDLEPVLTKIGLYSQEGTDKKAMTYAQIYKEIYTIYKEKTQNLGQHKY